MVNYVKMLKDVSKRVNFPLEGLLDMVGRDVENRKTSEVESLMSIAKEFHLIGYDNSTSTRQKYISFHSGIPLQLIKNIWANAEKKKMSDDDIYKFLSKKLGVHQVKVIKL